MDIQYLDFIMKVLYKILLGFGIISIIDASVMTYLYFKFKKMIKAEEVNKNNNHNAAE